MSPYMIPSGNKFKDLFFRPAKSLHRQTSHAAQCLRELGQVWSFNAALQFRRKFCGFHPVCLIMLGSQLKFQYRHTQKRAFPLFSKKKKDTSSYCYKGLVPSHFLPTPVVEKQLGSEFSPSYAGSACRVEVWENKMDQPKETKELWSQLGGKRPAQQRGFNSTRSLKESVWGLHWHPEVGGVMGNIVN